MIRHRIAAALRWLVRQLEGPAPVTTHHRIIVVDDEEFAELLASSRQLAMAFHPHSAPPVGEA